MHLSEHFYDFDFPAVAASADETGAAAVASETPAERDIVEVPRQKPRRLISLQYNYSDSDEEETREERKARIVSGDHHLVT